MRSIASLTLVFVLALTLAGCSGGETSPVAADTPAGAETSAPPSEEVTEEDEVSMPAPAQGSPEAILEQMQQDFATTQQGLLDAQVALYAEVGDTYDGYIAHAQAVQEWYDLSVSEAEALGARTVETARQYYRAVVAAVDHGDQDALDDAMDDFYDLVYDDAFGEFYDVIYDDAFDDMYDQYYDGIIDDAYDTVPYRDWYDVKSDSYESWYDAKADVYDAWLDFKSDVYDEWLDVKSGFYGDEFDIDDILRLKE